ncbi:MAG: magnesium/cobalt transporter CorA [Longimicrobiales bacterium]
MAGRFEIDPLSAERRRIRSWWLRADGRLESRLTTEQIAAAARSGDGTLWVDLDARGAETEHVLESIFRFHPLAVEDTRSPYGRVKLDDYGDYIFVTARGIRFVEETATPYDIETSDRHFFVGSHFVVTVHEGTSRAVEEVATRVETGAATIMRSPDHLFYAILDQLVDHYFPVLDEVDELVDSLEAMIVEPDGTDVMARIFALKRTLIALRRHLAPQRELVLSLATRPCRPLRSETQIYFRDIYDHVVRQVETIETYRDLLTTALETNLMLVSHRLNEVIKALSIIATIVLPPTLIASAYGMNFDIIPLADEPHGFWFALLLMVAVAAAFLLYLKRKEWL